MMKKNYNCQKHNVTKLPVYKKALYIFKLSRQIVEYLRGDKSVLAMYNSEYACDQFSDRLVMASLGLAPKIAMAETSLDLSTKIASVSSLKDTTSALLHYCENLEISHEQGKEFLHLLRKEVKKFGHLQNKWALKVCPYN